jgi:ferredoxin
MSYTVELIRNGISNTIPVRPEQTVLAAAEDVDRSLPFGCRTGACGTCTGRVLAGELEHRRPPRALKTKHLDAGYVLLCIAEPRADSRVTVGKDVVAELVENPWK